LLFSFLVLMCSACATTAHQSDALLKSLPSDITLKSEVKNVPFFNQAIGHCGPATLAMVMNWQGLAVSPEELAPQVYTPGMKGSFQLDMITASRRKGFMAVQIQGIYPLLKEISSGNPVIIFENLALTWAPQYHYAVVYGYDLESETVTMHSGPEKAKIWDIKKFERSWMLEKYWGLVILKPGELSASAGELAHLTAAAGLEQTGKFDEAEKSYLSILKHWPESLGSLVGLGNIAYAQKKYKKSVEYLRRAVQAHPQSRQAKHNLEIAESAAN
jgi:hypothetical protein